MGPDGAVSAKVQLNDMWFSAVVAGSVGFHCLGWRGHDLGQSHNRWSIESCLGARGFGRITLGAQGFGRITLGARGFALGARGITLGAQGFG